MLLPYAAAPIWLCPSTLRDNGAMSYHMNGLVIRTNALRTASVKGPAFTLLMNDAGEKRRWDKAYLRPDQSGNYSYDLPISNHSSGGNVTFADGHVSWVHDNRWNLGSFREDPMPPHCQFR